MVHLSYEAVASDVSVTRSHMSSCHLGSAASAVCGSVEVPGKECHINARVSLLPRWPPVTLATQHPGTKEQTGPL